MFHTVILSSSLSDAEKQRVVDLVLKEKWSPQAVADDMNVPVNSVRSHVRTMNNGELPKASEYRVTKGAADKKRMSENVVG